MTAATQTGVVQPPDAGSGVAAIVQNKEQNTLIGKPVDRVDGLLKVTGNARYSSEMSASNFAYAALVQSTIAHGRVMALDTQDAEDCPGVLHVLTHQNAPKLNPVPFFQPGQPPASAGHDLIPLQDDAIHFFGQIIGVVVANTPEQAEYAATLVRVTYKAETPLISAQQALAQAFEPTPDVEGKPAVVTRGEAQQEYAQSPVKMDHIYTTPRHNHNPIGLLATLAEWEGETLTVHTASQWVFGAQNTLAAMLGLPTSHVRVLCPYVGGAFGCGLRTWPHVVLTALAARQVGRAVKLVLTRGQMFTAVGHRTATIQHLQVGATTEGKLTAIIHENLSPTSTFDEYFESVTNNSRVLYACPHVATRYRLTRIHAGTPTYMRGPGESVGMFALESILDELAYALNLDPIELRLRNYADVNPEDGKPWSSKALRECYRMGAERFGWANRVSEPGSMRAPDGKRLGWGMASAMYPSHTLPASASARLLADNTALVQCGGTDIGPGTYTVMTQLAAQALGLPVERVHFELGDTNMPNAPVQGWSAHTASVGGAVQAAAQAVRAKILAMASVDAKSPLYQAQDVDVQAENGCLFWKSDPSRGETYSDILLRNQATQLEAQADSLPGAEAQNYATYAFGAQFAEVRIDPDHGMLHLTRFVGVYGAGRILNSKTARSQMIGGIIGGLGMATHEETLLDENDGRLLNANLGEYHIPVQADIGSIETIFLEEQDSHVNTIGVKGIGELGIIGTAAAIANAVYHATGKRIRELPITLDKLL